VSLTKGICHSAAKSRRADGRPLVGQLGMTTELFIFFG
jgi:hypothetical protein